MATVKIAVISLLFLFSDAARYPNTVDENLVVSRDALDTSAVALIQPPEKQEARTEPYETVALVLRPVGDKETETESSLPLDKKEKATSVSLPKLVDSFEHLRPFRLCHPRRHRFRGVNVVPLTFGDDLTSSRSRKRGEEEGDSTEEAAKHTVTVTSTTKVAVHEESVNREEAEGDQGAKKESRAQNEEEEGKATPTKIILPESNKEGEDGGRNKKEPKKKKDQEDSDSDSDSDSDDDMEKEMKKRKRKRKGGWWKLFWGLWD